MKKVDTILFFINDSKNKHRLIFKTLQRYYLIVQLDVLDR